MSNKNKLPLCTKLGLTSGLNAIVINRPDEYFKLIDGYNCDISFSRKLKEGMDFIHLFAKSKGELLIEVPTLKKFLCASGTLWISWPKKSSNLVCDLDLKIVKLIASKNGMTYRKAVSINSDWSAVKFTHSSNEKEKNSN